MAINGSASQRCGAVTTKRAVLRNTHTCPPGSRDVDTEDRGVFEDQTKKAQGQSLKRGKETKVEGEINDKYLCLLLSNMRELPCGA